MASSSLSSLLGTTSSLEEISHLSRQKGISVQSTGERLMAVPVASSPPSQNYSNGLALDTLSTSPVDFSTLHCRALAIARELNNTGAVAPVIPQSQGPGSPFSLFNAAQRILTDLSNLYTSLNAQKNGYDAGSFQNMGIRVSLSCSVDEELCRRLHPSQTAGSQAENNGVVESSSQTSHPETEVNSDNPHQNQSSITHSYVFQRSEYDEGLHPPAAKLFVSISDTDDAVRSRAIVAYNMGLWWSLTTNQSFIRNTTFEGNDDDAESKSIAKAIGYFLSALNAIRPRLGSSPVLFNSGNISPHSRDRELLYLTLHNVAYLQCRSGRHAEAMSAYREALDIAQTTFGPFHLSVASTANCIGVVAFHSFSKDESDMCMTMFTQALSILRAHVATPAFCSLYSDIATVMNNIGRIHYVNGEYEKALVSYMEALSMRRTMFDGDHLDVAAVVSNIGQSYHQLGELDLALKHYEEFLRIAKKRLPSNHRDVAMVYKCMGQINHGRGNIETASSLYDLSLRICRAALGESHPEVAATLNKIGNLRYENGDLDGSLDAYRKGLDIEMTVLPRNHPNIVVTLGNIARVHKHRGEHQMALERYFEMLMTQRRAVGKCHPETATTLHNIGVTHYLMGENDGAFEYFQEALRIRRDAFGDENLEVAATLNSIGLVLFKQEMMGLAIESFRECLRVRRKLLGNNHRDVAVIIFNIGTILLDQGDEGEALRHLHEALRVERAALRPDHPDLLLTLQHVAEVYQKMGSLTIALDYLEEILKKQEVVYGDDSVQVARTSNTIGNLYLQKGDIAMAMKYLSRSSRLFRTVAKKETEREDVVVTGHEFYDVSKNHPECAAVA